MREERLLFCIRFRSERAPFIGLSAIFGAICRLKEYLAYGTYSNGPGTAVDKSLGIKTPQLLDMLIHSLAIGGRFRYRFLFSCKRLDYQWFLRV